MENSAANREDSRFTRYIRSTSTHGVVHIFKETTWFRRFFWLLVVLLSATASLYFCIGRIRYMLSKPTSTTVTTDRQLELDFPAVTVCNLNVLREDYLQKIKLDDFIRQSSLFNYQDPNETETCATALKNVSTPFLANTSYQSLLDDGMDALSELIVSCEFQGGPCKVNDSYFVPTMTRFGTCYTFNSGRGNRPILKSYGTGSRMGLRLTLNVNRSRYVPTTNYGTGIKVAVHHQFNPPQADDGGIAASTRKSTFIGVLPYVTTDRTKRNCKSNIEVTDFNFLNGDYNYSYASCRMDCYYTQIAVACHCILIQTFDVDDGLFQQLSHCTLTDLCCIMKQQAIGSPCKCLPSCTIMDFDLSTSNSDLPEDYTAVSHSSGDMQNILTVSVYFKSLSIRREVTSYSYDFGALLGDIGGQLGLFLGISVISITEFVTWIVDEIIDRIIMKCFKRCKSCKRSANEKDELLALATNK